MTKNLEDLQERFENGEFDDSEVIDLLIHYRNENNILLKENKKLGEENCKLHHYKLLYQKVKERNDKAIKIMEDYTLFDLKAEKVMEVINLLKGNIEEVNDETN